MNNIHLSVQCLSRSKNHNSIAAAAYRSGARILDDRTGQVFDYARRNGVYHSQIVYPDGCVKWDRSVLWNLVEASEKRKNSTVAREIVLALPHQLPHHILIQVTMSFARWVVWRYGFVIDAAVHRPTPKNDKRNWHAHLLCTTRVATNDGFGSKCRILDAAITGSLEIRILRQEWTRQLNQVLELLGMPFRVDHRSYADMGIDRVPTIKVGRGPGHAHRRVRNKMILQLNSELKIPKTRHVKTDGIQAVTDEDKSASFTMQVPRIPDPSTPSFETESYSAVGLRDSVLTTMRLEIQRKRRVDDANNRSEIQHKAAKLDGFEIPTAAGKDDTQTDFDYRPSIWQRERPR